MRRSASTAETESAVIRWRISGRFFSTSWEKVGRGSSDSSIEFREELMDCFVVPPRKERRGTRL